MNTTENNCLALDERKTVNTKDLKGMLSCGRDTAVKIGEAAGARVQVGKRVLWNVSKIQDYLDSVSNGGK